MTLRKIMFIPPDEDYEKLFGSLERKWFIPKGCALADKVCYADDGSPVVFGKSTIIKAGKRKFLKLINEGV